MNLAGSPASTLDALESCEFIHEIAVALVRQSINSLSAPNAREVLSRGTRASCMEVFVHESEIGWLNGGSSVFPFGLVAELAGVSEIALRKSIIAQLPTVQYEATGPCALIKKKVENETLCFG